MVKTTNSSNQAETRDLKIMLLIGMAIAMSLGFLTTPARGDSCGPSPKVYGSTVNIWTPQLLLDSPYLGSATGFSGVQEELDYNFLVTGAQKIDQQGWLMSRQNGEASGVFEVGSWQQVSQQTGCPSTDHVGAQFNGYYKDPSINATRITTAQLAPPGTTSDASVINQFSFLGFNSMTFDMRYARLDVDLTTWGGSVTATASGDCGLGGCGSCGVIYNCTFFNPQVSIGFSAGGLGVSGNIEMKYASTQAYDYSYSFPSGYEWYWNYKSSPNFLMAFNYVGQLVGGGGGGTCPPLPCKSSPWIGVSNGPQYTFLNNILGGGLIPAGSRGPDVSDYYVLPSTGDVRNAQYSFEVFERGHSTDYFDSLALYAVDHPAGTSVLATSDGRILTYTNPKPPIVAIDDKGTNLTPAISSMSSSSFVEGAKDYTVYLNYGPVQSQTANLILRARGNNTPMSVYVDTGGGQWTLAGNVTPREDWSMVGMDLSALASSVQGAVKLKLVWQGDNQVNFVGLDTSTGVQTVLGTIPLKLALHGAEGDVTSTLANSDGNYLTLGPLDVFRATFQASNPAAGLVRDVMLVTIGHYTE